MKRFFALVAVMLLATPAFAFHCPSDMAEIDAALSAGVDLPEKDLAKVKKMRAKGERLHKSGDHSASVAALGKAKKLLGL